MKIAVLLTEKPAGLRYWLSRALNPVRRRAFAHLGRGTSIVSPQMLQGVERISIGDGVTIREDAWLAAESPAARLTIGSRVYVGHRGHFHAVSDVSVGDDCVFADGVLVNSGDHKRSDRHGAVKTGPISIGDRVFVGQHAIILGGVHIGDGATVGAGAVVTRDVPAGATVAGVPARQIGGHE